MQGSEEKMTKNHISILTAICLTAIVLPSTSPAEDKDQPKKKPSAFKMNEVEIKGEIERPDVFYIIPRRKVSMELNALGKDYSAEIMQPLLPAQFAETVRSKKNRTKP